MLSLLILCLFVEFDCVISCGLLELYSACTSVQGVCILSVLLGQGYVGCLFELIFLAGPYRSIESPAVTFDQLVEHVGVNKGVLDQECSDEHLREIAALLHNWLKYAELLGLKRPQIMDIDSNKLLDSEGSRSVALVEES